jgi:RNA polymerase sigma-70 factor (ECF subfamily)
VSADDDGFDEFYERCRDRLVLAVVAVCGDSSEAMDFVQEAFVRAWSRWPKISGYDDPEGWVRRVAFNLAVGRWRTARRMVLHSDLVVHAPELAPDQQVAIEALKTLPVPQRRALVLHHLVGLSVVEVAAELSVPVGTVKSWLSRGRDRLAVVIAQQNDDLGPAVARAGRPAERELTHD